MDIYEAIQRGRKLSAEGKSFSFSFMSYNSQAGTSEGVIEVRNGRFLSREDKRHHRDAEIVERYINLDTMETRHFYQPLLMTFEGEKVILQ